MTYPKYFKLSEFLTSSTARQKSIENLPEWNIVENLCRLGCWLDGLREKWGSGIIVSSGYRCDKLNKAVGGVDNSVHKIGYAADLQPANGDFEGFKRCVREWVLSSPLGWDQCIIESKGKTRWIHLGLYAPGGGQRRKIFSMAV